MPEVTIVYTPKQKPLDGCRLQAAHIDDATTEKLQAFLDSDVIAMFDYILVRHRAGTVNQFKVYTSQDDFVAFVADWSLSY